MKRLRSFVSMVLRRINWRKVGQVALTAVPLMVMGAQVALAVGPAPAVHYTNPDTGVATTINTQLEGFATTIRWILGGTALVALLVAAVMNHVPNQRYKDMAREVVMGALVGLLIAAFGPTIINWLTGLSI